MQRTKNRLNNNCSAFCCAYLVVCRECGCPGFMRVAARDGERHGLHGWRGAKVTNRDLLCLQDFVLCSCPELVLETHDR